MAKIAMATHIRGIVLGLRDDVWGATKISETRNASDSELKISIAMDADIWIPD